MTNDSKEADTRVSDMKSSMFVSTDGMVRCSRSTLVEGCNVAGIVGWSQGCYFTKTSNRSMYHERIVKHLPPIYMRFPWTIYEKDVPGHRCSM